jgi:M6 family metalloprotease-like protein
MRKNLWLWALLMVLSFQALAVPAYPELIRFTQPNSKDQLNIYLKGDERVHWAETEDGYSLLHVKDGSLYYAMQDADGDMVASSYRATDKGERSLSVISFLANTPLHLRFSQKQVNQMLSIWNDVSKMKRQPKTMKNVQGEKNFLVILFAFNDQAFTHTKQEFENLFNQINYTANGNTGSVHDYYYQVSQGLFSLHVDVVGPFTGSQSTAHYGNSSSGSQDFAEEAVDSASHYVNFSHYDNDSDGYIDGLHIIFAGHGEEATGNADEIWSHKWNIFSSPTYNNTVVNVYSCSPECGGNQGNTLTAIGVICHELGHVFGAPDYYDTDYSGSGGDYQGLGKWDIMSSGSWNRNGYTPAQHNPYTKIYIYHWATCDTLTNPQNVVMRSCDKVNTDFHRINTNDDGDFFLLENRQRNGWDAVIPGHGLLVYHINPDVSGASLSNASHPQDVYILANTTDTFPTTSVNSYGDLNSDSAPFPGSLNRTQLTDNTCPALRPWSHTLNNTPLTYISENTSSQKIFFCYKGAEPMLQSFCATGESDIDVKLKWDGYGSLKVLLLSDTDNNFVTPTVGLHQGDTLSNGNIVSYIGNADGLNITNLQSNTTYYYRLYLMLNDSTFSSHYLADTATTNRCASSAWRSEDFDEFTSGVLPECWRGDGWTVDATTGTLRSRNYALDAKDYGDTNLLILPPFSTDSGYTQQHFVMALNIKSINSNGADTNFHFNILLKNSIDSAWQTLAGNDSNISGAWKRIYFQLYNCTRYTQVALQLVCHDSQLRRNSLVNIDSITLAPGCLLHSYVTTEGGDISVEGYNVYKQDTTIRLVIRRHPGYAFHRMYLDGHRVIPIFDTLYDVVMSRRHELYSTFYRNIGIEESEETTLSLYPNPVHDNLHIILPAGNANGEDLILYDIIGHPVLHQTAKENEISLDVSGLPRGIYFLRVDNHTYKVVKE